MTCRKGLILLGKCDGPPAGLGGRRWLGVAHEQSRVVSVLIIQMKVIRICLYKKACGLMGIAMNPPGWRGERWLCLSWMLWMLLGAAEAMAYGGPWPCNRCAVAIQMS